jgi:hypothetical protein
MGTKVDANFSHSFNGHWVNYAGWAGSPTGHGGCISQCRAQDALSDMAATAVAGAED